MIKSFLELNINHPHNKSEYSIKKNKLIILPDQGLNCLNVPRNIKKENSFLSRTSQGNDNKCFGKSKFSETRTSEDSNNLFEKSQV